MTSTARQDKLSTASARCLNHLFVLRNVMSQAHMAKNTDDACLFSSVVFETSWLWLLPIFLQSNVVWYAQREGRGIYKSTQVFISGWNRSFARAPARSFVQVSVCGWNRNFDGGGTGLATEGRGLSARASSTEGTLTYLYASGKASGKSTAPQVAPPSSSATFHALQCGHLQVLRGLRVTSTRDVRGGHRCARVVPRGSDHRRSPDGWMCRVPPPLNHRYRVRPT